jgi:hypothetical protein
MLVIRQAQVDALRQVALDRYIAETQVHLRAFARRHCEVIGEQAVRSVIVDGITRASKHGFTDRGPVRLYIELMFMFGSAFDTDPQWTWAANALADPDRIDAIARAERLHRAALDHLDAIAGPGHRDTLNALRRVRGAAGRPMGFGTEDLRVGLAAKMAALYPEKCAAIGAAAIDRLIDSGLATARRVGMGCFRGEVLCCVLAFALGHGFADDSLYPWVGRTLRDERFAGDADQLAQRLERRALTYLDGVLAHFGLDTDV